MTLPSYRTQQESDLAAPLWPGNASEDARASLESTADSLPGYPPTSSAHAFKSHPDAGLTMTRRTGGQIGRNCIYRFTSRFPMESHKAQILGRLAYSKEVRPVSSSTTPAFCKRTTSHLCTRLCLTGSDPDYTAVHPLPRRF